MKRSRLQMRKLVLEGLKSKLREETEETKSKDDELELDLEDEDLDLEDEEIELDLEEDGDSGDIIGHLETALENAKALGDEKLIDQIGNTITFYTRAHIVGKKDDLSEGDFKDEDEKEEYYLDLDDVNENLHSKATEIQKEAFYELTDYYSEDEINKYWDNHSNVIDNKTRELINKGENLQSNVKELTSFIKNSIEGGFKDEDEKENYYLDLDDINENMSPNQVEDEVFHIWDLYFDDGRAGISKGVVGKGVIKFELDYSNVDKYEIEPFEIDLRDYLESIPYEYQLDFGELTIDTNIKKPLDESLNNFKKLAGIIEG